LKGIAGIPETYWFEGRGGHPSNKIYKKRLHSSGEAIERKKTYHLYPKSTAKRYRQMTLLVLEEKEIGLRLRREDCW